MIDAEFLDAAIRVLDACRRRGLLVATAESCTGGTRRRGAHRNSRLLGCFRSRFRHLFECRQGGDAGSAVRGPRPAWCREPRNRRGDGDRRLGIVAGRYRRRHYGHRRPRGRERGKAGGAGAFCMRIARGRSPAPGKALWRCRSRRGAPSCGCRGAGDAGEFGNRASVMMKLCAAGAKALGAHDASAA